MSSSNSARTTRSTTASNTVKPHHTGSPPLPIYPYLTKSGLLHLKNYKYISGLSGFIDRVIMTPFWNWCVEFIPMNIAPNLITAVSLAHAFVATFLITGYSPSMSEQAPNWVYIVSAMCMFMYQTLDAIDGKQARRTGSSSPLGQLFDHGCDAICAFLMGIFVSSVVQFGGRWESLIVMYMHIVPFYVSNWEESCTGVMIFGLLGVTEGQFLVMSILLSTGILGPDIWLQHIFGISIRYILMIAGSIGGIYQTITSSYHVYEHVRDGKISAVNAFYPAVQYIITMILCTLYALSPYTTLFTDHPYTVLLIIGCVFGYQISRLIIFHVANESYVQYFYILTPLPILVINAYWPYLTQSKSLLFNDVLPAQLYLALLVAVYLHYLYSVVEQICTYLNINCFTIVPTSVS